MNLQQEIQLLITKSNLNIFTRNTWAYFFNLSKDSLLFFLLQDEFVFVF